METEKAREIGFCFGVRRAIDLLEEAAREHGTVETLGAVVHNRVVIEELARGGVRIADSLEDVKGNVIAISSHGVGPQVLEQIRGRHLEVIDATCPRVRRAQRAARDLARSGFYVIVFGDANHPEVKGVLGWAGGKGIACADPERLSELDGMSGRIGILSQTTQSHASFAAFAADILSRSLHQLREVRLVNTICQATRRRQAAAIELARRHDLVIVVGGHSSSNTRRLAEACAAVGAETHLVETAAEVDVSWLSGARSIGIAAGTSTPDSAIEEVIARLRELDTALRQAQDTAS
ncbi:MAG: 4-hydroxy-3-methylbut-2-enyl diphosphate reductase [Chloroflexota bacterium]